MCPGERPGKANKDRWGEEERTHNPGISQNVLKMEDFCGFTAFVVRRFEGVEFVGGIIEPINMDSSNQDSNNSTINTKTTRDIYRSRRNRTART